MYNIYHSFPINASPSQVFAGISTPEGLDAWWAKSALGKAETGAIYTLDFGPAYRWKAIVTQCRVNTHFELQMTEADADWTGSKLGFALTDNGNGVTDVHFYHTGWPELNHHYRFSSFCWAMYLRLLRRNIEFGELVPYEKRLSV